MSPSAWGQMMTFLDSWLSFHAVQDDTPGFVVAIRQKGVQQYTRAFGKVRSNEPQQLSVNHLFNIGSQAKMLTAILTLQLVEQGRLRLEDYAATYLPWLSQHSDHRFRYITIQQLLWHGSGLVRDGNQADYWQLLQPFPSVKVLQKLVLESELIFESGQKLKYSNIGYALLGQIIETASGQSYRDLAAKQIIEPLGLDSTFIDPPAEHMTCLATGHTRRMAQGRQTTPAYVQTNTFAAVTGWFTTAQDMSTILSALATDQLLQNDTTHLLLHGLRSHWQLPEHRGSTYGLGVMQHNLTSGRQLFGHSGAFIGHRSCSYLDLKQHQSVVVMANTKDAPVTDIAIGVWSVLDHFERCARQPTPPHLQLFNCRLENTVSVRQIVATAGGVVSVPLDDWRPFASAEELTQLGPTTFKITKAFDFMAEGELVTFNLKNDALSLANYAGWTMWPAAVRPQGWRDITLNSSIKTIP